VGFTMARQWRPGVGWLELPDFKIPTKNRVLPPALEKGE
jgi:hypothetical protein